MSEARQAGRGVLYIAGAKLYFMVAGAIIEFSLPAILSKAVFGAYAVVASMVSPLNNVLITGTIQAVSRFTARDAAHARAVERAGFKMHLFVGLPVAAAFIGLSPVFAWFFHDQSKIGPLMLAGLIVAGYALYAVMVGTANGRKEFGKQASLDITMATIRGCGILGLALAGFGLYGAISGWVGAVGVILVVAALVVGLPGRRKADEKPQPMRPMVSFFARVAVYLILLNLLMFVDQMLLKRLTAEWYSAHGYAATEVPSLADVQVGYYRAVQNMARLPYQFIIAVTFVIFPLVSRTTFANEADTTRRYVGTTMRYSFIFAAAIAVAFAANPTPMLDVLYATDYAVTGGSALTALALGNVAFSLFAIAGTILNGAGLTRQATLIAGVTLVVAIAANALAIPRFEPGTDVLLAAGTATAGAMTLGAALGGWLLYRNFGAFMPLLTVVRVSLAIAGALGVGRIADVTSPLMTLAEAAAVALSFFVILVVTRELTLRDLRAVTSIVGRQKGETS